MIKYVSRLKEFLDIVKERGLLTRQEGSSPSFLGDDEITYWAAFTPDGEDVGEYVSGWDGEPVNFGVICDTGKEFERWYYGEGE